MKRFLNGSWLVVLLLVVLLASIAGAERVDRVLTDGWRFVRGDPGDARGVAFDDSGWERVRVPHDWAIAGPFDAEGDPNTGKLPWRGVGWYRVPVDLSGAEGQRVQLIFDGVMAASTVYLNGVEVGAWDYGYTSFSLDVTDAVAWDEPNVLSIRVDTTRHRSRWYPGGGLYRKVTLRVVDPVHVPVWGQSVTTPEVGDDSATVRVVTEVRNDGDALRDVTRLVEILGPGGEVVATTRFERTVGGGAVERFDETVTLTNPERWDVERAALYEARSTLLVGDEVVDRVTTAFGVRTFEFTADDGFHLNGRRVQIYGVNLHHDHGPLGAAFYPDAMERQLRMMKRMGVNAIRTSHNPSAPELLAMCDRMGLVVFNELFDKWDGTAGFDGSLSAFVSDFAPRHIEAFMRRDRNHPSVVVWSIGNEIGAILSNSDGKAPEHVAAMVRMFKRQDPTRPVAMGMHVTQSANPGRHILDALDVQGWNYASKYSQARLTYPDVPMIYSESASAFSNRDEYIFPLEMSKTAYSPEKKSSGYDRTAAPWADLPEHEFDRMREDSFVAGEFVWTGYDYLGEPTPFAGKVTRQNRLDASRSSYFGIVDLAGLPKDRYWLYRSVWLPEEPTVHVLPHWSWPGREGLITPVYVYTNGDSAELFLNGESLGRKTKRRPGEPVRRDEDSAEGPVNLAAGKRASASSSEVIQDRGGNVLSERQVTHAIDGLWDSRWCAEDGRFPQWWQVDLGERTYVRSARLTWERSARDYRYTLRVSDDGETWRDLAGPEDAVVSDQQAIFDLDAWFRYFRIDVTGADRGRWASLYEVELSGEEALPIRTDTAYYEPLDQYRLMWNDVRYEPGELRVVAYEGEKRIGSSVVRTAGRAAALRLTPERGWIGNDGLGLGYVRVELVDGDGNVCPHDDRVVRYEVEGAAGLVAVGNGDPRGLDSFVDSEHPLFHGKAVAILRGDTGGRGRVTITATAEGVEPARVTLEVGERGSAGGE